MSEVRPGFSLGLRLKVINLIIGVFCILYNSKVTVGAEEAVSVAFSIAVYDFKRSKRLIFRAFLIVAADIVNLCVSAA